MKFLIAYVGGWDAGRVSYGGEDRPKAPEYHRLVGAWEIPPEAQGLGLDAWIAMAGRDQLTRVAGDHQP